MRERFQSASGRSLNAETYFGRTMLKCLWSAVATSVRFRRSAIAITDASTMPKGRLAYCSTSSAMREMSPSSTSANVEAIAAE